MSGNAGCLLLLIVMSVVLFALKYYLGYTAAVVAADLESFYRGFYFQLGCIIFVFLFVTIGPYFLD